MGAGGGAVLSIIDKTDDPGGVICFILKRFCQLLTEPLILGGDPVAGSWCRWPVSGMFSVLSIIDKTDGVAGVRLQPSPGWAKLPFSASVRRCFTAHLSPGGTIPHFLPLCP